MKADFRFQSSPGRQFGPLRSFLIDGCVKNLLNVLCFFFIMFLKNCLLNRSAARIITDSFGFHFIAIFWTSSYFTKTFLILAVEMCSLSMSSSLNETYICFLNCCLKSCLNSSVSVFGHAPLKILQYIFPVLPNWYLKQLSQYFTSLYPSSEVSSFPTEEHSFLHATLRHFIITSS